jgi:hypothetical protein
VECHTVGQRHAGFGGWSRWVDESNLMMQRATKSSCQLAPGFGHRALPVLDNDNVFSTLKGPERACPSDRLKAHVLDVAACCHVLGVFWVMLRPESDWKAGLDLSRVEAGSFPGHDYCMNSWASV